MNMPLRFEAGQHIAFTLNQVRFIFNTNVVANILHDTELDLLLIEFKNESTVTLKVNPEFMERFNAMISTPTGSSSAELPDPRYKELYFWKVKHSSEKAWLLTSAKGDFWVPKSVAVMNTTRGSVSLPNWFEPEYKVEKKK